jgi:hypothetical protein
MSLPDPICRREHHSGDAVARDGGGAGVARDGCCAVRNVWFLD